MKTLLSAIWQATKYTTIALCLVLFGIGLGTSVDLLAGYTPAVCTQDSFRGVSK